MSAFLGPIHYWLYNKIQQQQAIVNELYSLGAQYDLSLEEECNQQFGVFLNKPLEEMIDHGNIHGWLQEKVSQVEYKYAYCVTALLNHEPEIFQKLKSILAEKGAQLGRSLQNTDRNAPFLFKVITDNLLDGMPCDHANSIVEQQENELLWKRNVCVHQIYWDEVGGDISVYYELRDSWMEGLAKEYGFTISKVDTSTYLIKSEK
jgi:hypothetical protein